MTAFAEGEGHGTRGRLRVDFALILLQGSLGLTTLGAGVRASVRERSAYLGLAFGNAKIVARVANFIARDRDLGLVLFRFAAGGFHGFL